VSLLSPVPLVVLVDHLIDRVDLNWGRVTIFRVLTIEIHGVEVVVLLLVSVREIPVDTEILAAQVVPIVGIGIVRDLVVVHIFAWHEAAGESDKFTRVDFAWSTALLAVRSWHPASSHDEGSSVDADRISTERKQCSH